MNASARPAAAIALAALFFAACIGVQIPRTELRGWHEATLGDTAVLAMASPETTLALARDVAAFDAAFERLLGGRIASSSPTTMILVPDTGLGRRLRLGRGIEGWAASTMEGEISVVRLRGSRVSTRITLLHEYTHLMLARNRSAPLPRWYNEGVADYFSTLSVRDGALVVGAVPTTRLAWLVQRKPAPLSRIFKEPPIASYEDTVDFYATSWGLVHYLAGTPTGRSELSRFVHALARGVDVDDAFDAAFDRPLERLENELESHIGFLARGVAAEIVLDDDLDIAHPSGPRSVAEEAVARRLGLLALASSSEGDEWVDLDVAVRLLEIGSGPVSRDATAAAGIAEARAMQGRREEAASALAQALASAPDDASILVRAGRARLDLADPEAAREAFERAIEIDEGSAPAWFGLGRALDAVDQRDAALLALEQARSLGWSVGLDLELGRLYLEAERLPEARRLLLPIASDPHGGSSADQAREMLQQAGLL